MKVWPTLLWSKSIFVRINLPLVGCNTGLCEWRVVWQAGSGVMGEHGREVEVVKWQRGRKWERNSPELVGDFRPVGLLGLLRCPVIRDHPVLISSPLAIPHKISKSFFIAFHYPIKCYSSCHSHSRRKTPASVFSTGPTARWWCRLACAVCNYCFVKKGPPTQAC